MKLKTRAEVIRGLLNAAKHIENKKSILSKASAKWLRMVADALLMEYIFESKCVLSKVRIAENLNGLTITTNDEELIEWCMRTMSLSHILKDNVQNLYYIPEVTEFRNLHSKNGLLIRDEKDNLVPSNQLAKQK